MATWPPSDALRPLSIAHASREGIADPPVPQGFWLGPGEGSWRQPLFSVTSCLVKTHMGLRADPRQGEYTCFRLYTPSRTHLRPGTKDVKPQCFTGSCQSVADEENAAC